MIDLEEDPFLITNWEAYAKACIDAGELWRFRKALCDYIWITNRPHQASEREYVVRRQGEWAKEKLEEKLKKKSVHQCAPTYFPRLSNK